MGYHIIVTIFFHKFVTLESLKVPSGAIQRKPKQLSGHEWGRVNEGDAGIAMRERERERKVGL